MKIVKSGDQPPQPDRAVYDLTLKPGDTVRIMGPSEAGVPPIVQAVGTIHEITVGLGYVDYAVDHWINGERTTTKAFLHELELIKAFP